MKAGLKRGDPPPVMGSEMRAVRRALADAGDDRVLQVLRYVDKLAERGSADALLAPLRERLAQLRPPRPLRFSRALFIPLDGVLVNAGDWRPGATRLPRSIIMPIAALVRRTLPAETAAAEAILALDAQAESERIADAGAVIWPCVGPILRAAAPPPEWEAAGLPPTLFKPLAVAVATCLDAACALTALADPSIPPEELDEAVSALLSEAEKNSPLAWGLMLTLALQRFPQADSARKAALARTDPGLRAAAAGAAEAAWTWIESGTAEIGLGDPVQAAAELSRRIVLLEALGRDPAQRRRTVALQAQLRRTGLLQLEMGLQEKLIAPLQDMTPEDAQDVIVVETLEQGARAMRHFDAESRRLGGAAEQDAALRAAAAAVRARTDLAPMDQLRLIELLLGSQAAQMEI